MLRDFSRDNRACRNLALDRPSLSRPSRRPRAFRVLQVLAARLIPRRGQRKARTTRMSHPSVRHLVFAQKARAFTRRIFGNRTSLSGGASACCRCHGRDGRTTREGCTSRHLPGSESPPESSRGNVPARALIDGCSRTTPGARQCSRVSTRRSIGSATIGRPTQGSAPRAQRDVWGALGQRLHWNPRRASRTPFPHITRSPQVAPIRNDRDPLHRTTPSARYHQPRGRRKWTEPTDVL